MSNSIVKERDLSFDFIKGILILLVVYGHTIPRFSGVTIHDRLDTVIIYTFHMPLFIFISGYFATHSLSKSIKECMAKVLKRLFIPAFLWTIVYFFVFHFENDEEWARKVVSSFRSEWFLYCLCYLYLLGCVLYKSRYFLVMAILIFVLGYAIYPFPGVVYIDYFQIIRQWPLFVMGVFYYRNKTKFNFSNYLFLFLLSIFMYLGFIIYLLQNYQLDYILSKDNYLMRAIIYQSGAIVFFVVLMLIYNIFKKTYFLRVFVLLGQNTLGIYVMNEILIRLLNKHLELNGYVPLLLLSLVLTFTLLGITLMLKRNKLTAKYLLGE